MSYIEIAGVTKLENLYQPLKGRLLHFEQNMVSKDLLTPIAPGDHMMESARKVNPWFPSHAMPQWNIEPHCQYLFSSAWPHEYRSTKFETISNDINSNDQNILFIGYILPKIILYVLNIWTFGFQICFGLRLVEPAPRRDSEFRNCFPSQNAWNGRAFSFLTGRTGGLITIPGLFGLSAICTCTPPARNASQCEAGGSLSLRRGGRDLWLPLCRWTVYTRAFCLIV